MQIDFLTLFPELIDNYFTASIMGSAQREGLIQLKTHDFRSASTDSRGRVDDAPFGGGAGMVLGPQPIFDYIDENSVQRPVVYMSPTGATFNQAKAQELSKLEGFTLLCGRYEGLDQRVRDEIVDEEISVGDFVLAGGESAAIVVAEAVLRLVPGVLGNEISVEAESFSSGLLEYPHYTRPADFKGLTVPEVLLSGDHGRVERWRLAKSLQLTAQLRPDLIAARGGLTQDEKELLDEFDLRV